MNVLTVETGQGSSERATQEAAAVDYGSAACSRKTYDQPMNVCVCLCVGWESFLLDSAQPQAIVFQLL